MSEGTQRRIQLLSAFTVACVCLFCDTLIASNSVTRTIDTSKMRFAAFALICTIAAPAMAEVLLFDDLHLYGPRTAVQTNAPQTPPTNQQASATNQRSTAVYDTPDEVIGVMRGMLPKNEFLPISVWFDLLYGAAELDGALKLDECKIKLLDNSGGNKYDQRCAQTRVRDFRLVPMAARLRAVFCCDSGINPFRYADFVTGAIWQRLALGVLLVVVALNGATSGDVATRSVDLLCVAFGSIVVLAGAAMWAEPKARAAETIILSNDAQIRSLAAMLLYAAARVCTYGFYHCSTARAQTRMYTFNVSHDFASLLLGEEGDDAHRSGLGQYREFEACTTCSTLVVTFAVTAGAFATMLALGVACSRLDIPSNAHSVLYLGAAALYASADGLVLQVAEQMQVLHDTTALYSAVDAGATLGDFELREQRRFAQVNTPAGLALYAAAAFAVAAHSLDAQRSEGRESSRQVALVGLLLQSGLVLWMTAAHAPTSITIDRWDVLHRHSELSTACVQLAVAWYAVEELIKMRWLALPSSLTVCLLAQWYFWFVNVWQFAEGSFNVDGFVECGKPDDYVAPPTVYVQNTTVECTGFAGFWNSDELGFFTVWCLFYCALYYSLACLCAVGKDYRLLRLLAHYLRMTGTSIAIALFFCASALFTADDGSKAHISRDYATRDALSFLQQHVLHVLPWLLLWQLPLDPTVHTTASRPTTTPSPHLKPNHTPPTTWLGRARRVLRSSHAAAIATYLLAPSAPLVMWLARSHYPDAYPNVGVMSVTAIVLCGILPWLALTPLVTAQYSDKALSEGTR